MIETVPELKNSRWFNEFDAIIKARNKESLELADAEIKRAEESVRRQEEIAANGQENILAQEQARLEKANLAKQREAERAAKPSARAAATTMTTTTTIDDNPTLSHLQGPIPPGLKF